MTALTDRVREGLGRRLKGLLSQIGGRWKKVCVTHISGSPMG